MWCPGPRCVGFGTCWLAQVTSSLLKIHCVEFAELVDQQHPPAASPQSFFGCVAVGATVNPNCRDGFLGHKIEFGQFFCSVSLVWHWCQVKDHNAASPKAGQLVGAKAQAVKNKLNALPWNVKQLIATHTVGLGLKQHLLMFCISYTSRSYVRFMRAPHIVVVDPQQQCIFQQKKQSFGKISLQHTACQSMTAKGLPGKQELQDKKELTTQNSCSRSLALRTNHRMLSGSTS